MNLARHFSAGYMGKTG